MSLLRLHLRALPVVNGAPAAFFRTETSRLSRSQRKQHQHAGYMDSSALELPAKTKQTAGKWACEEERERTPLGEEFCTPRKEKRSPPPPTTQEPSFSLGEAPGLLPQGPRFTAIRCTSLFTAGERGLQAPTPSLVGWRRYPGWQQPSAQGLSLKGGGSEEG